MIVVASSFGGEIVVDLGGIEREEGSGEGEVRSGGGGVGSS